MLDDSPQAESTEVSRLEADRPREHFSRPAPVEAFELDDVRGEIVSRVKPHDLAGEIRRLMDPATATETVHWGRNYLYRTRLTSPDGPVDVVVKQFRNQGLLKRLRRQWRGSKATLSWRMARDFEAAGLKTAEALVLIESKHPEGPACFVARHLSDVMEARYVLRAANRGAEAEEYPHLDLASFFDALGRALRQMHEAGFFHRDLSIGNVLLPTGATTLGPEDLYLIDLNRTRRRRRLSLTERTRDLCRLAIFRPEHQRMFLEAYWGRSSRPGTASATRFITGASCSRSRARRRSADGPPAY